MRRILTLLALLLAFAVLSAVFAASASADPPQSTPQSAPHSNPASKNPTQQGADTSKLGIATFAGGCFWCTESDFAHIPGVVSVTSGFAGGPEPNPTYKQVSAGQTGHRESIQLRFDPAVVSYRQLVEWFWRHHDATDDGGQFCDRGSQYRAAIFVHTQEQRTIAEESRKRLIDSKVLAKPVVTPIIAYTTFYPAEDYHQRYFEKNPVRYKFYRYNCGRDKTLKDLWGAEAEKPFEAYAAYGPAASTSAKSAWLKPGWTKPSQEELKARLTPLQYKVTQHAGTEPPFKNDYDTNKREGIYVDILSGEPLFSSTDKFDSGTGWPSFLRPLEPGNIVTRQDRSLFSVRTEVRSKLGDNHIGHVFDDGPKPTGLRYCMNSAALRFVPREDMEKEGYGQYLRLFAK